MAVNINIPSQVRTFANLAAFPATGAVKTIYIAEDTNKTYRWTGTAYVEISGADFSGFVPTSRTLTINGVAQDLSADRSWTISTGLTVGTTPISSGTNGRVLFQGTGNVLQQSSSLFWDNVNQRAGLGTSTPAQTLDVNGNTQITGNLIFPVGERLIQYGTSSFFAGRDAAGVYLAYGFGSQQIDIGSASTGNIRLRTTANVILDQATSKLLIGTSTDAGFRLDVNGTARVQDLLDVAGTNGRLIFRAPELSTRLNGVHWVNPLNTGSYGYIALSGGTGEMRMFTSGSYFPTFYSNGSERMRIPTTGNVLINTTTDAGFRLDVNGTARVSGDVTSTGSFITTSQVGYSNNSRTITFNDAFAGLNYQGFGGHRFKSYNSSTALYVEMITLVGNQSNLRVGINSPTPNSSAILDVVSTDKGFLPPRMTTTEKNAIASPATGLMVYDTTLNLISVYNGTTWTNI
jgi:hypothetical protein